MKSICLCFELHQPLRLKKYRFFDIGNDVNYLDNHLNKAVMVRNATHCYKPMNKLLKHLIDKHKGQFKVSFCITGSAIELMREYTPDVIDSFKELADTGCVEFLAGSYSNSLLSLVDDETFKKDVLKHTKLMKELFNVEPKVFRNSELIYSDSIGELVAGMGFEGMITEGARHILGWRSAGYVYNNVGDSMKLLLRNSFLSDELRYRFSDSQWRVSSDKFFEKIKEDPYNGDIVNLFLSYETFGEYHRCESGIFGFMEHFPHSVLTDGEYSFTTPSQIVETVPATATLHVPYPISWTDEERDTSAWLGNELQQEAMSKLHCLKEKLEILNDPDLNHVWDFLNSSDNFLYMNTKRNSSLQNIYDSPYEAFINYMNVLTDLTRETDKRYKLSLECHKEDLNN